MKPLDDITVVGLLINFGAATLKEGLQRIVNNFPSSVSPRLRVNQLVARRWAEKNRRVEPIESGFFCTLAKTQHPDCHTHKLVAHFSRAKIPGF